MAIHKIELRTGRWFCWRSRHDERQIMPAEPGETVEAFSMRYQADGVTEQEGTGVRVTDSDDNIVEDWIVRRNVEGALELATALLDKYEDR